jgi:hypothetical protein
VRATIRFCRGFPLHADWAKHAGRDNALGGDAMMAGCGGWRRNRLSWGSSHVLLSFVTFLYVLLPLFLRSKRVQRSTEGLWERC